MTNFKIVPNAGAGSDVASSSSGTAWRWIPTLYFAEGIPYVVVMTLSVVMYKNLQVSNTDIAYYTSWLYLPWVIKPLWSPLVDLVRTKRWWIVLLQLVIGAALACVALTIPGPAFFRVTLAVFWLMAFSSATHDIAADGFYLLAMPSHQQAAWVGGRSLAYRLAMIAGQGGLVALAGAWQEQFGSVTKAWSMVFGLIATFFGLVGLYHAWALPRPATDRAAVRSHDFFADFFTVFVEFFRKPGIGTILAFLLLYRLAEAQALKLVTPFLLDARTVGGLGLSTQQVGFAYGTVGVVALIIGGIVGGLFISWRGLKNSLWPMIVTMHVPIVVFALLAWKQPTSLATISTALAIEQFGYGFGFTAYMLYMIMVAEGAHKTAHYAICTGFMALGMMLPGMAAGWLEDHFGYTKFFCWVLLTTIPSFVAAAMIKVDPGFGKKAPR